MTQYPPNDPNGPQQSASQPSGPAHQGDVSMWAHLLNIVTVIGPLIFWLVMREKSSNYDREGKEALNFGITVFIASLLVSAITTIPFIGWILGGLLSFALAVAVIALAVMAGIQTNKTGGYRYPFSLRLIS
ncbi:MAG: DUF4870 domain-containing protein [Gulosibacter sp.]|uniref:DUF4870 domain-containing protein n=1 Tax=Gulosibacter sp. TaxID=2817531 RepID=UPI003F91EEC6